MCEKNAEELPGRSSSANEQSVSKHQTHSTTRGRGFSTGDGPPAEETAPDDLAEGTEDTEDDEDSFASEEYLNGAEEPAESIPILPSDANALPMTKKEAKDSVRFVKLHYAKSMEHATQTRRALLQQFERRAWEVLGYAKAGYKAEACFQAFAQAKYGFARSYAYQLLQSSRTERQIHSAIADEYVALREYPLRRLSQYAQEHRVEIYIAARKLAGKHPPTGKQITDTACALGYLTEKQQQNGSNTSFTTILHEPDNTAGNCPQIRQARCIQDTGRVQMQICDGGRVFYIWLTPEQLHKCGYVPESGVKP